MLKFEEQKYSSIPFWFWNGDQQEAEITRQLELAAQGGCRGMTFHARVGNRTEYMSDRWLELVRHACIEAKRLGLELWLYDEEGFPSATVGGRLPDKGGFYQCKCLRYKRLTAAEAIALDQRIAVFTEPDYTPVDDPAALPPETPVLTFQRELIPWLSDCLSREVCEEFMAMTHQKYEAAVGEYLGTVITTLFTDDLNHTLGNGPILPYTDLLFDRFQEKYGYDLKAKLPWLVEDLSGADTIRIDYRSLLAEMFAHNFVKPMQDWALKHGMQFTGHLSGDEGPVFMEMNNYTDPMAFYEFETIPGIDDFLSQNRTDRYLAMPANPLWVASTNDQPGFSIIQLCKKASSVANQLKEGLCSSEVNASLGWGCPVRSWLAQIRMELGLGINLIIPHAFFYSTAGRTKRDHPQSFFFQSPYYFLNKELTAGINRSVQLLSRGRSAADTLVIYPVRSCWLLNNGATRSEEYEPLYPQFDRGGRTLQGYNDQLSELSLHLVRQHVEFEFGSEDHMARFGSVEGKQYKLGHAVYQTVIVPDLLALHPVVLEQLRQFSRNGGRVILFRSAFGIEGAECVWEMDEIAPAPALDLGAGTEEVLLHTRNINGRKEYYLVNFGAEAVTLSVPLTAYEYFDPDRGIKFDLPEAFTLQPCEACHLLPAGTVEAEPGSQLPQNVKKLSMPISWKRTVKDVNTLVFDHAVSPRGVHFHIDHAACQNLRTGLPLSVPFDLDFVPEQAVIYVEPQTGTDWKLNGIPLDFANGTPHRATPDLLGLDVQSLLKTGRNELTFRAAAPRLESMYLEGDFEVELVENYARIVRKDTGADFGAMTRNGYPFYWGTMEYTTEFDWSPETGKVCLRIPSADAVLAVEVNGETEKRQIRFAPPWDFLLDLKPGRNSVRIIAANTPQNFFGPFRTYSFRHNHASVLVSCWKPEGAFGKDENGFALAEYGIFEEPYFVSE